MFDNFLRMQQFNLSKPEQAALLQDYRRSFREGVLSRDLAKGQKYFDGGESDEALFEFLLWKDEADRLDIHLTDDAVRESDVVITMGCGDTCPFYPGKRYEDWVLDDPAGKDVAAVRPIRDEIRRRVEALLDDLVPAAQS